MQGPFGGGLSSVELAAAVSNAGGLGSFGAQHLDPAGLEETIAALRASTDRAFNVNLWVSTHDVPEAAYDGWDEAVARLRPLYDELGVAPPERPPVSAHTFEELVEVVLATRPPVLSFVYGIPGLDVLEACREAGIVTIGTAITVEEAVALDTAGVDAIVVSGFEAGGHRVAFLRAAEDSLVGTLALVPAAVDAVRAPVIAAGGIADRRGVQRRARARRRGGAGRDGVPGHAAVGRERRAPGRRSPTARGARGSRARSPAGSRAGSRRGSRRWTPSPRSRTRACLSRPLTLSGDPDFRAFWAGQAAPLVRPDRDAVELLRELAGA